MTRPPIVTPADEIPAVPEGTVLRMRAGDWSHSAVHPEPTYLDVVVSRVHSSVTRQDEAGLWTWVSGHEHPRCTWKHVERHAPCLQMMVRVDVLRAAVSNR